MWQLNLNTNYLTSYIFVKTVLNKFFKLGYTYHSYSHISEANYLHKETLNIAEKAPCEFDIFYGINEILLLPKFKKKITQSDTSWP